MCHHTATQPGRRTGGVANEPAWTDTESADLIAEQRTLNPRVRGSSPWRRTRPDLGILPAAEGRPASVLYQCVLHVCSAATILPNTAPMRADDHPRAPSASGPPVG